MHVRSINAVDGAVEGVQPLPGFKSYKTHHCVTGSMLHVYHFNHHRLSEDMLLGLGAGVGFFYWHMKGQTPMLLGRGNVHRPGVEGLEIDTGKRSGVSVRRHVTKSQRKSTAALLQSMEEKRPLMIHVDMAYLPYFDLPEGYHFGQHVVVVAGMDSALGIVLLADRDGVLHPISMEGLSQARASTFKPFPPVNTWYTFDFEGKRLPTSQDIWPAITEVCDTMLRGPISNLGVRGIERAATAIKDWPRLMDEDQLRETAFNGFIFIDAEGGTGGGMFRYMYSRFLHEAAQICNCPELSKVGEDLVRVGDGWQEIALGFREAAVANDPGGALESLTAPLSVMSRREAEIWESLDKLSPVRQP